MSVWEPSVFDWQPGIFRHPKVRDSRREMIDQTSAFLSWALSGERDLPRIPCRKVDEGGYTGLSRKPGARALMIHWWNRALDHDWLS